jgi:RinA family phage transcriptional activator
MRQHQTIAWSVSSPDYKRIKEEVDLYEENKKELERLVNHIMFETPAADGNGGGRSNLPSSPVENKVIRMIDHRRIQYLKLWIDAVDTALHKLDDEKKTFMAAVFWQNQGRSLRKVASQFAIDQSTANRWRKGFLLHVGELTGAKRGS